jgi:hypothetical protein
MNISSTQIAPTFDEVDMQIESPPSYETGFGSAKTFQRTRYLACAT